jgi:hypothetical protein
MHCERPIAAVTLAAIDPKWEPYAGKPHVRICAGGALSNERPYRDHLIRRRSVREQQCARLSVSAVEGEGIINGRNETSQGDPLWLPGH